jgi:hypothetical protein
VDSALEEVLKRTNLRNHVIVYDETRRWPAAEREAAFGLGILRQIEDAEYVTCNASVIRTTPRSSSGWVRSLVFTAARWG